MGNSLGWGPILLRGFKWSLSPWTLLRLLRLRSVSVHPQTTSSLIKTSVLPLPVSSYFLFCPSSICLQDILPPFSL